MSIRELDPEAVRRYMQDNTNALRVYAEQLTLNTERLQQAVSKLRGEDYDDQP